jgi:hypothetical protein
MHMDGSSSMCSLSRNTLARTGLVVVCWQSLLPVLALLVHDKQFHARRRNDTAAIIETTRVLLCVSALAALPGQRFRQGDMEMPPLWRAEEAAANLIKVANTAFERALIQ